ncbi:MAG: SAM-dependent methyltransferase [Candidatus Azotimanducaceae bacterium]|jgi:SAM-dependent methyltransferase
MQDVKDWFTGPLGQLVLANEERVLEQLLPGFFGYHLLQLSPQETPLFSSSVIHHKLKLTASSNDAQATGDCMAAEATELPFAEDSLDVVLLHHMLEFHREPLKLLREVSRVALPMGQLVIVGFNPMSLWGACQPIGRLRVKMPWTGNFIPPGKLMDWLNVLNFTIDRAQYCLYGWPTLKSTSKLPDFSHGLSRNANLPFGGIYIIVARKQVGSMIKVRPVWQRTRAFGRLSVVPPARPATGRGISTRDLPPED